MQSGNTTPNLSPKAKPMLKIIKMNTEIDKGANLSSLDNREKSVVEELNTVKM